MALASKKPKPAAGKKTKGKALPAVPRHASDVDALMAYMNKHWNGPLKTCLEALNGGDDLEVSEALTLISHYLLGSKTAISEISKRVEAAVMRKEEAEAAAAVAESAAAEEGAVIPLYHTEGGKGAGVRGLDLEKWLSPPLERTIEGAIQDRFQWSSTRGPAEELAARIMAEVQKYEEREPRNGIVPSVPDEAGSPPAVMEKHFLEMLAVSTEEAVLKTSDLVNTDSLLLLETFQVDDSNLQESTSQFQEMAAAEGRNQQEACLTAASLLLTAVRSQRRMNGELTTADRERVMGVLDTIRTVVMNAANDVVGYVSGVKDNLEVYCAARAAEEVVSAETAPADEAENGGEDKNGGQTAAAAAEAEAGKGEAAAGDTDPKPQEDVPAETNEAPKPAELEGPASEEAPAAVEAPISFSTGDLLLAQMDDLAAKVLSVAESAVVAMEEDVEGLLFDRGADLAAMIAKAEREVVHTLALQPWQVKLEAAQQTLLDGIHHVLGKLTDYSSTTPEGPTARSRKGKAAQARALPTFEVLALLISTTCHCIGDTERALGIGLLPGEKEDLETLDPAKTPERRTLDTVPENLGFQEAMSHLRLNVDETIDKAITDIAHAAAWTTEETIQTAQSLPLRLLSMQFGMCSAVQRLQSRLMCSLKSMQLLTTVTWDEVSLEVLSPFAEEAAATQSGVQEIAAVIPLLKAGKALHSELTATWPDGEPKIIDWLPFAFSTVAELERCCRHLTQEIEGYAELLNLHISDTEVRQDNTQGIQAGTPLASAKVGLGETDAEESVKRDIMGDDEPPSPQTADVSETAQFKGDTTLEEEELEAAAAMALQQDIDDAQDGNVSMAEAELEEAAQEALLADIEQESKESNASQPGNVPAEGSVARGTERSQTGEDNDIDPRVAEVTDEVMQVLKMVTNFMQGLKRAVSAKSGQTLL